ncbi:MAG: diguanylate cyclase [Acidobacteria bacterium]|nr:diguanylate cyclase [Acidobacteriota bacterium]
MPKEIHPKVAGSSNRKSGTRGAQSELEMSLKAKLHIASILFLGLSAFIVGVHRWDSHEPVKYFFYLLIALLSSGMKIRLPGVSGSMSANFLFILIGLVELSLGETVVMACVATALQTLWQLKPRPKLVEVLFNVASMAVAVLAAEKTFHSETLRALSLDWPIMLVIAAAVYFVANTFPIACVTALTEGKPLRSIWRASYFWTLPYYLVGAAFAALVHQIGVISGWQSSLLVVPVLFVVFRSYRLYLGRLEDEKVHAEEMASLHLRTIEALALAIEAKDHTTHDHLQRVQVYAMEVGRELGLSEDELHALRAASLLHDIGKLAVPEHIISKPGKLTREEFEKMKIHPIVGAEILERVKFPYPVVPIVRAHHERWNGSGYPDGLKGDEIPIGARILATVDCLDALASDRQYRRALPLDDAMQKVVEESGISFDPRVVDVLRRRYVELERLAQQVEVEKGRLSTGLKVERGVAPAAGLENLRRATDTEGRSIDFLASIAAARQEVQALFELAQDLGNSLSLNETLSVVAARLKKMVPYDAIAIYIEREQRLIPEYVSGDNFRLFSSLEIPVGHGLSGWVAENRKPIVNGNPSVEPGYLNDPSKFSTMRSALAVPLEGLNGNVLGVVTLYHGERDAFTKDHLRILLGINAKLALSIENALKYRQAESSASTDYLTGLPNARSLFLHLDGELSRCRRLNTPLGVLVCDLDGFKQVNDRFGHLEGNKLLREVATGLKQSCREYDYIARMGGDEFVLVLPGLTPDALEAKVNRLRHIVVEAGKRVCNEEIISISVGQALYPEDGADAEQLLAEADRRMYKFKQRQKMLRQPSKGFAFDYHPSGVQ